MLKRLVAFNTTTAITLIRRSHYCPLHHYSNSAPAMSSEATSAATATPAASASVKAKKIRPRHIFCYGTLRDDDDTGASYTKPFLSQLGDRAVECVTRDGRIYGLEMWQKLAPLYQPYPYSVRSAGDSASATAAAAQPSYIQGRLHSWPSLSDAEFAQKLAEADDIEGYEHEASDDEDDDAAAAATAAGATVHKTFRESRIQNEYDRIVVDVYLQAPAPAAVAGGAAVVYDTAASAAAAGAPTEKAIVYVQKEVAQGVRSERVNGHNWMQRTRRGKAGEAL
jgi:hypothetical protein